MQEKYLRQFVVESNRIEGITLSRYLTGRQVLVYQEAIDKPLNLETLESFVLFIQHDGRLRSQSGMNVRIANHLPPLGGPSVVSDLCQILEEISENKKHPFIMHREYETLHPFMDGNGRSGRFLWLWQMANHYNYGGELGFLHKWYYQSLDGR